MLKTITMMAIVAFLASACQSITMAANPQSPPDPFAVADGIECWYETHDPANLSRPFNDRLVTATDWETVSTERFACPQQEIALLRDAHERGVDITLQALVWARTNGICALTGVQPLSLGSKRFRHLPNAEATALALCEAGVDSNSIERVLYDV